MRLDAYSKATRLSYFLTNSTPDQELLRAAGAGELDTEAGSCAPGGSSAWRSPRFEGAVRAFFEDMLQFEMFEDVAKDPVIYPAYNSVVAADAQEQTLRTITDHLITKKGDYRDLFTTADHVPHACARPGLQASGRHAQRLGDARNSRPTAATRAF